MEKQAVPPTGHLTPTALRLRQILEGHPQFTSIANVGERGLEGMVVGLVPNKVSFRYRERVFFAEVKDLDVRLQLADNPLFIRDRLDLMDPELVAKIMNILDQIQRPDL